jgi:hypothetical protein
MSRQVIPVEEDLVKTQRESIRRKNESLLFRRGKTWNVDDVTGGCITIFRESWFDHKWHRRGHFFNYRLKRMHGNRVGRHFTFRGGGEVRGKSRR